MTRIGTPAAVPARARSAVRALLAQSLIRSSAALIANTAINAVLGFAYWIAAARLYPAEAVGGGAAGISGLILAASVGWTGLQYVLLRYLAVAGRHTTRLVLVAYGIAALVALPAALGFLAYARLAPQLDDLVRTPVALLAFAGGTAIWVVFSLQDAVLIGLRRSAWVPLENGLFGFLKLALLVLFGAAAGEWGLVGSWIGGAVLLVVVMNAILFTRVLPARRHEPHGLPPTRSLARFATGHHLAALVGGLPDSLVPLLVVALLSEQSNAYYYAAWTVSNSMRLIATNIANALTVEGAHDADRADRHIAAGWRLGLAVVIPLAIAGIALAGPIVGLFGRGYAEASPVLAVFSIGLVPFALVTMFVASERIGQRTGAASLVLGTATVATIGLDLVLIPSLGIVGAAFGWLAAQVVGASVAGAITIRRARRAHDRDPVDPGCKTTAAGPADGTERVHLPHDEDGRTVRPIDARRATSIATRGLARGRRGSTGRSGGHPGRPATTRPPS